MGAAEAIAAWRDFYGAVANAAAALLGLVFVGISLHLGLRRVRQPMRTLAMGSAITLIQPLLVALVMLIPVGAPGLHAAGLVILALVLAAQLLVVVRSRIADHAESRFWLIYRFGIPLAASVALGAGGIGLLADWSMAVYAPAFAVFAMAVVGVQDAFDLLMGTGTRVAAAPTAREAAMGGRRP